MEIAQEKRGAVFLLGPVGRLDTDSAADLELALQDLLATGGTHFVVDLAQINYVSSAGLRVLLMLAKSVDGKGSLRIAGLNAQVQQVFDIAGFTKLFKIHPDRDAALRDHPGIGIVEAEPAPVAALAPRASERTPPSEAAAPAKAPAGTAAAEPAPAPRGPKAEPPREAKTETPREAKSEAPREATPVPTREPTPAVARESVPPAAARPPAPVAPPESSPERAAKPMPATAASAPRETPPARAPAPTPEAAPEAVAVPASAPLLADHVARLLGVGPAANAPFDPSVKSLGRHAAMLLGVALEGGSAPASKSSASKAPRTPSAPPAVEPEEKGGLLSRLFGKKKRSNI